MRESERQACNRFAWRARIRVSALLPVFFDPSAYHVVLIDQRGCGRSTPHAGVVETDLASNNTANLVADIEVLRQQLAIDRWLVFAGSWGCTLALAYAETHPDRVTEMILFGVTTGRHSEFDWTFRGGVAAFFPEQWDRLRAGVPEAERDGDIVEAYSRLLHNPDFMVRQQAADDWCLWESATAAWPPTCELAERFKDQTFAFTFARIVTHYVRHNAWLEDGSLLQGASSLAGIPGILINGRFDFQAPIANAWELNRVWPNAQLVIVSDAGHLTDSGLTGELIRATDRFVGSA